MEGTISKAPVPDNLTYVVPVDNLEHTTEKPFCWDSTCDCHEDELLIAEVAEAVFNGLLTPYEATDFVAGRTV
jgi:hypothetical protein